MCSNYGFVPTVICHAMYAGYAKRHITVGDIDLSGSADHVCHFLLCHEFPNGFNQVDTMAGLVYDNLCDVA